MDGKGTTSAAVHAVDNARDVAGDVMTKAGAKVRSGSKHAAELLQQGGSRTAEVLENSGAKVSKHGHRGLRGYLGSHRARFLLVALVGGVIAFLFVRGRMMGGTDGDWDE